MKAEEYTMATWMIGGLLLLMVGGIVWKMVLDKRRGKSACSCSGDCSRCHADCSSQLK
ncbi:MAG: FeoB-associated Cys-rich membrane protein [Ruthenibacterium sp.]